MPAQYLHFDTQEAASARSSKGLLDLYGPPQQDDVGRFLWQVIEVQDGAVVVIPEQPDTTNLLTSAEQAALLDYEDVNWIPQEPRHA